MAIIVKKQPKTITNRNNSTSSKMKALLFNRSLDRLFLRMSSELTTLRQGALND